MRKAAFAGAILFALMAVTASAVAGQTAGAEQVIWLEAEQFAQCGGWSNDPQFVAQMGSPYLLATGVGKPVADAVTKARVARPGPYRLWVRGKDWYPQHSPGQFQVVVAGRVSATTFCKAKDDRWQWVDGGVFDLDAGEVEVRLHDTTGWWGRCDAVVLSADNDFRPADDPSELARQRETYGGVSREIQPRGPYDVVVVGGGLAGSAAAVAAARLGCRVALIQDRPVLGGNASVEIGVSPEGDSTREPLDPRETGIVEEFNPQTYDPNVGRFADWSSPMEKVVRAQKNLDLFLNTRATGVEMSDKATIAGVQAMDAQAGTRYRFAGRLFVDCTGDGWIGFWAGAEYEHGSEGRDQYGESIAAQPSGQTMGNTLYNLQFRMHDEPAPFETPPWAYQWDSPDDFDNDPIPAYQTKGERPANFDDVRKSRGREPKKATAGEREWWVELGGMQNTIQDAEAIRDELFRINIGLWGYVKNHHPKFKEENRNRELVWVNYVPGTRESRRLMGDYVMTQRDYAERIVHSDTVAYCGWGTDIHHPWGFFSHGNMYYSGWRQKTSIPYRCLYSKNISNLLMAGRNISVSHIALGSVRVMRTCCIMGQAAGTAAAIAARRDTTPRGVYENHMDELQETLLKDGAYLIERPNHDGEDLARTATVSASSVAEIADPRAGKEGMVNGGLIHDLNTRRAVVFTARSDQALASVALFLRSENDSPTPIKAALRGAAKLGDFSTEVSLAEATAAVPPRIAGWVEFDLKAKLERGKLYYITLPPASGLKWDLYPFEPADTTRAYGGPQWKPMYGCYKFRLNPGGEPLGAADEGEITGQVRLSPENVINGWSRAVEGKPNSWRPDPTKPLPQWIELRFPKPTRFNTVHVTFQLATMAATAYRIEAQAGGKDWETVVRVDENKMRRRLHTFESMTADGLRLVIEKPSFDGQTPRVCEVRVYNEPAQTASPKR